MDTKQIIDKKVEYWKKKLIDLSKRNNLVNYRFTKSKSLQIKKPDFIFFQVILNPIDFAWRITISTQLSLKYPVACLSHISGQLLL